MFLFLWCSTKNIYTSAGKNGTCSRKWKKKMKEKSQKWFALCSKSAIQKESRKSFAKRFLYTICLTLFLIVTSFHLEKKKKRKNTITKIHCENDDVNSPPSTFNGTNFHQKLFLFKYFFSRNQIELYFFLFISIFKGKTFLKMIPNWR